MVEPHADANDRSWTDALPRSETFDCPYVAGRRARQFGFLADRMAADFYQQLMDLGMRRSGQLFYGMDCPDCRACVPLRIPVAAFRRSRSQRRTWNRNQDVTTEVRAPRFSTEGYDLYRRYLEHQHPNSPQTDSEQLFRDFLYRDVVDSIEVLYRLDGQLIGVSVLDRTAQALSSVYHFFAPEHRRRRIGVYSILSEIERARADGIPFYYLGYWIGGARTMHYKTEYGPHELLVDGIWKRENPD